jgi:hypothetical protein
MILPYTITKNKTDDYDLDGKEKNLMLPLGVGINSPGRSVARIRVVAGSQSKDVIPC